MITLKEITEDNFNECLDLEVEDSQKNFVAPNTYSLAQAWLYPETARPFVIYNGDVMVGFLMLAIDCSKKTCGIWRFMIDKKYQRMGYGKAAMQNVINYVKEKYKPNEINLSFVQGNEAAENLYKGVGFAANGKIDGDEIVMVLDIGQD